MNSDRRTASGICQMFRSFSLANKDTFCLMTDDLYFQVVRSHQEMEEKKHFHKREQVRKILHQSGTTLRSVAAESTSTSETSSSRRSLPDDMDDRAYFSKRPRLSS